MLSHDEDLIEASIPELAGFLSSDHTGLAALVSYAEAVLNDGDALGTVREAMATSPHASPLKRLLARAMLIAQKPQEALDILQPEVDEYVRGQVREKEDVARDSKNVMDDHLLRGVAQVMLGEAGMGELQMGVRAGPWREEGWEGAAWGSADGATRS